MFHFRCGAAVDTFENRRMTGAMRRSTDDIGLGTWASEVMTEILRASQTYSSASQIYTSTPRPVETDPEDSLDIPRNAGSYIHSTPTQSPCSSVRETRGTETLDESPVAAFYSVRVTRNGTEVVVIGDLDDVKRKLDTQDPAPV